MPTLVLALSSLVVLVGCGKDGNSVEKGSARDESALNKRVKAPCPNNDFETPSDKHLGDGVHDYHYSFIWEYLERNRGSATRVSEVERRERDAQRAPNAIKPPSANVVESSFSHLLGAVMRDNGGVGAAVFDSHGLKVGAAGLQLELMVLTQTRLDSIVKLDANGPSLVQRYSCPQLEGLVTACDPTATRGLACSGLKETAKQCEHELVSTYRPVKDTSGDVDIVLGVSMLIALDRCP